MLRLEQGMDATWGRGKMRTEVWEGDVNPANDWWRAYEPSEEEVVAAGKGYNFSNPKKYFEDRGIDSAKAMNDWKTLQKEMFDAHIAARNAEKVPTEEEFTQMKADFIALNKKIHEASFRMSDDNKQVQKGQPVLGSEDTGARWRNDKK
eukprot:CAMPEP_0119041800 /NCGR_PEP_ID=MMETSP1177-20130426/13713_1 /TAXON_ID=2985 /ORGANISM="Ochromonas sp, Strain CCMP1899" /LENGTH=148 /DNA_ID=CAMNT_0007008127 /DNA_START=309 /DNA_END=755 /DNA_ORIENTATION=+